MVIGAFVLMAIGFNETGGYDKMIESYFKATAANRNYVQWIFPPIYLFLNYFRTSTFYMYVRLRSHH